jgi:polygalacturonase
MHIWRLLFIVVVTLGSAAPMRGAEQTVDIRECGAVGDGKTLATAAIQKAIDQCAAVGGGIVRFPPGKWLSGTIVLRSGVTLHLEEGATLLGGTDLKDYPHHTPAFPSLMSEYQKVAQSLIYAERVERIALRGKGLIDGQGGRFSYVKTAEGLVGRPFVIRMIECKDVLVEGITLRNSASWMESYLGCDNLTICGIKVHNFVHYNNDCIDIDGCQNVRISDVDGSSDDDGLCFKGTSLRPTRNVIVENCRFTSHCNSLKFGTDSQGALEDVQIRNVELGQVPPDTPKPKCGCPEGISGMSWEVVDGGTLQNVTIDNVKIRGTTAPIFVRLGDRGRHLKGQPRLPPGKLRNLTISNVHAEGATPLGCPLVGLTGHPIENLTLRNVSISFAGGGTQQHAEQRFDEKKKAGAYPEALMFGDHMPAFGLYCWHVKGLRLQNVQLTTLRPDQRPAIALEDAIDTMIDGKQIEPDNLPPGVRLLAAPAPPDRAGPR